MFQCPMCKWKCGTEEQLQEHVLRVHKQGKPVPCIQYQCTRCNKQWSNYETIRKHLQTCTGVQCPREEIPGNSGGGNNDVSLDTDDPKDLHVDSDGDSNDNDPTATFQVEDLPYADTLEEKLQKEVADFLVHIKEDCCTTETTVNEMIIGIKKIQRTFVAFIGKLIQDKAGMNEVLHVGDVLDLLEDVKEMNIFEGVDRKDDILDYLQENEGLVMPQREPLQSVRHVHNGKIVLKDVEYFYFVPFLKQLKRLLNNKDVLHCVDNPKKSEPYTFASVIDGLMYQQHFVVRNYQDCPTLSFILYHDGVDVVDSKSSRSGKHAMTFFYWQLGNIYPEFRSSDRVVQLYAVVKSAALKRHGFAPILAEFIEGINKLSSPEGVVMDIQGVNRKFHGILQSSCGDYPANAAIGGFKEAVSAEKPCGQCMASNENNYLNVVDIQEFETRTEEMHKAHLEEIEHYRNLTAQEKAVYGQDPSVKYGVNSKSVLMDIRYFDVTKGLSPDLMHTVHEGVLEFTCRLVLRHVITDEKELSLAEVNERIGELSKFFSRDRPGVILDEHLLPNKKLRQSAAQMRVLSLILPFALQKKGDCHDWTFAGKREFLECLLAINQILNFSLAYKFHILDADRLRKKVQDFHKKLLEIAPNVNLFKLHALHHLVDLIIVQGGIRQVSCIRYEAHHALFKRLARVMRNFVNPMESISIRHQTKQCRQMTEDGYLYGGHQFTVTRDVTKLTDRSLNRIRNAFPNHEKIEEISRLKMNGTLYKESSLVLLSNSKPEFGLIKKLYVLERKDFAFICQKVTTLGLATDVNAFELSLSPGFVTIDAKDLVYPHEVVSIKWNSAWYALLLGHTTLLS